MSMLDDEGLPDMQALHKTNDLIPDPAKLRTRVIPAEDIAGWFLPFEMVFGMVYWQTIGIWVLLAFIATILFGWIIPMQQRYALLAKAEFMKEKTQLGHLVWEEQCEILRFEPILEPAFKKDEEGKLMLDDNEDTIVDELDLDDWVSTIDMEERIIEHDDGMLSEVHTLDSSYLANLFQTMYAKRMGEHGSYETDKIGWFFKGLGSTGGKFVEGMKWTGKNVMSGIRRYAPSVGRGAKSGAGGFRAWFGFHKARIAAAITLGIVLILFGNWIWFGMRWFLTLLGWTI